MSIFHILERPKFNLLSSNISPQNIKGHWNVSISLKKQWYMYPCQTILFVCKKNYDLLFFFRIYRVYRLIFLRDENHKNWRVWLEIYKKRLVEFLWNFDKTCITTQLIYIPIMKKIEHGGKNGVGCDYYLKSW